MLRELARDSNSGVRTEALEALASFSRPEALSVLCDRALASDHKVAVDAIRGQPRAVRAKNSKRF